MKCCNGLHHLAFLSFLPLLCYYGIFLHLASRLCLFLNDTGRYGNLLCACPENLYLASLSLRSTPFLAPSLSFHPDNHPSEPDSVDKARFFSLSKKGDETWKKNLFFVPLSLSQYYVFNGAGKETEEDNTESKRERPGGVVLRFSREGAGFQAGGPFNIE